MRLAFFQFKTRKKGDSVGGDKCEGPTLADRTASVRRRPTAPAPRRRQPVTAPRGVRQSTPLVAGVAWGYSGPRAVCGNPGFKFSTQCATQRGIQHTAETISNQLFYRYFSFWQMRKILCVSLCFLENLAVETFWEATVEVCLGGLFLDFSCSWKAFRHII